MARFCGICGSPLDPATGLCPNCNVGQVHMEPVMHPAGPADGLGQTEIVDASAVQGGNKAMGAEPASMQGQVTDAVASATSGMAVAPDMARPQRRAGRVVAVVGGLVLLVALVAGLLVIGDRTGMLALTTQGKVTRQLSLGQKYLLEEDYEQAEIAFNKAIELDPRQIEAYEGLIEVNVATGDYAGAVETYHAGTQYVAELSREEQRGYAAYEELLEQNLRELVEVEHDSDERARLLELLSTICDDVSDLAEEVETVTDDEEDYEADDELTIIEDSVQEDPLPEGAVAIATVDDLRKVADDLSGYYVLTADLDLQNAAWDPIGSEEDSGFTGIFDGNGHTIRGLDVTGTCYSNQAVGLFGYVTGGTIKRLHIVSGASMQIEVSGEDAQFLNIGGIAGVVKDGGTVEECRADVTIIASGTGRAFVRAGGICGVNHGSRVVNCEAHGMVQVATASMNCMAGLVSAWMDINATIENCYVNGSVQANARYLNTDGTEHPCYAGGIDGSGDSGQIISCVVGRDTEVVSALYGDYINPIDVITSEKCYVSLYVSATYRQTFVDRDNKYYAPIEFKNSFQDYMVDMGWDSDVWTSDGEEPALVLFME